MVKVGINGFGRIGRNVLRAALGNPNIQIAAINDLTDSATLAHLLKYDSLLGTLPVTVDAADDALVVDGQRIAVFSERDPAAIPWRDAGIEVVIRQPAFSPGVRRRRSISPKEARNASSSLHLAKTMI